MMLVALVAVFAWWFYSRVQWRWFWAGAGIWTVGVALKFAVALPLNPFFFGKSGRAAGLKLVIGSVYCGLMTGIFEIGITLAAAFIWRRLARGPARALPLVLGSALDGDPHRAGGARDDLFRRLHGGGVEVGHLGLGDLPHLRGGDRADLEHSADYLGRAPLALAICRC